MPTELFLAWRFLREGRMQTLLVAVGATIGITVVFFLTALVGAVERTMIAQTLDVLPHVVVRRPDDAARAASSARAVVVDDVHPPAQRIRAVQQWRDIVRAFEGSPDVVAISPMAAGPGMAFRGRATRAVSVMGVDPERFARVIAIRPRMITGSYRIDGNAAVIGSELAADLGIGAGDRVRVSTGIGAARTFVVAGTFDAGSRDVNRRWVLVSLRNGQTVHDIPGGVSSIDLRLRDPWRADAVAAQLEARTGLTADSWTATNSQLTVAIQSQRGATVMIRVFVALAVAIGIASVLVVSVVQRSRQIGILRAMGLSRSAILRIFLWQGGAIGLVGALFGTAAGSVLALLSERSTTNPDGAAVYPIELSPSLYLAALLLACVAGTVAFVLPARRAAGLEPADAIRSE